MRLWWVSISLFMELEGELGVVIFFCCSSNGIPHWLMRLGRSEELVVVSSSFTSSTSSNSWKRDMVDSLVRSISTSIQLLPMEAVFSMSKWSEEKVSRRPPCPRNCVSMVGCVVVVYLLLGQSFWTSSFGISSPRLARMFSSSASIIVPLLFLSYLANFFPSSSVCPRPTHTFLVVFIPRAYITSPRKKRSSSPLPSQSEMSQIVFTASASTILSIVLRSPLSLAEVS